MNSKPHALYRFYGDDGSLLYVGITLDPGNRWKQHKQDKPWWSEVTQVTIEPHVSRDSVLEAERAAIYSEKPRYNVVHNRGRTNDRQIPIADPPEAPIQPYTSSENEWVFHTRKTGWTRVTDLHLHWEVSGDPITDDWIPEEINARDLMQLWMRRYGSSQVSIYWSIWPIHETAPFQNLSFNHSRDFLTYYSWPESSQTGERLNFNRLPVLDKAWIRRRGDKGGFFQQATGWKPAPLQSHVDLDQMLSAASLAPVRQVSA